MKPVGNLPRKLDGETVDKDVANARSALLLGDDLSDLSPVILTEDVVQGTLRGKRLNLAQKIVKAKARVRKGKDVMVFEGVGDVAGGLMFNLSDPQVARLVKSRMLLLAKYDSEYVVDRILIDKKVITDEGRSLLGGVVINDVPKSELKKVKSSIVPFLEKNKVPVLGVIPKDPLLKSVTVAEVAEHLRARVLAGRENSGNMIGSFIVGAMSPFKAIKYFRAATNKAVITGGDRSDILLAALETKAKCLILTGNSVPSRQVISAAEEAGVPLLLARSDTMTTVHEVDSLVNSMSVTEGVKLNKVKRLIQDHVDLARAAKAFKLKL